MTPFHSTFEPGERRVNTSVQKLRSLAWALGLLAAGWTGAAGATEALEARVDVVAKNVAQLLKAQSMEQIAIGQFSGPPNFPTSSGPAIVQMFNDAFGKYGIECRGRAPVGLAGEYSITEVPIIDPVSGKQVKQLAVKINGRLVDQFGGVLTSFNTEGITAGKFETTVPDVETFVSTIGVPVDLPAEAGPVEVDQKLRDSLVKPTVHLDPTKTRYKASPDSPYEIEILCNGQPLPIHLEEDLPYVDIQKGQTYAIRVYNHSEYDAAAKLLIDGLSVFEFSNIRHTSGPNQGKPKYTNYIIAKGDSPTLKGWHKDNQHVESFLVTGYSECAAATLGHTQNLGTITVTFAAAWPKGSPPPPDEFISKSAGGNATGFGPPLEHKVEEVQRDIGRVRASLCVRYAR
jgi:hypothetical protein